MALTRMGTHDTIGGRGCRGNSRFLAKRSGPNPDPAFRLKRIPESSIFQNKYVQWNRQMHVSVVGVADLYEESVVLREQNVLIVLKLGKNQKCVKIILLLPGMSNLSLVSIDILLD